jgi:choline dehydrogenase-like flavoprotein
MGPDPTRDVVDADLRVHFVPGLRVADASVFPYLIAGNTKAPAILVGWLGAARMLRRIAAVRCRAGFPRGAKATMRKGMPPMQERPR